MAMAIAPQHSAQYQAHDYQQYQVAPAQPQQQQLQIAPAIHQTVSAPAPAPRVVETRVVHITQPSQQQPTAPVRQYVTFKNLRHLNSPGNQWENCEHITMEISPDEIERQIRRHDLPGNDLLTVLGNMGVMRTRHINRYEEKLNRREPDPGNWKWVLEGLGELTMKRERTPHTFWAIFTRVSRRDATQQSRNVRLQPEVTVHHEPAHVVDAAPSPMVINHPRPYVANALPPPPTQLQLPAPATGQRTYAHPQAGTMVHVQPARSVGAGSASGYQLPASTAYQVPASSVGRPHTGYQMPGQFPPPTQHLQLPPPPAQQPQQNAQYGAQPHVVPVPAPAQYAQPQQQNAAIRPPLAQYASQTATPFSSNTSLPATAGALPQQARAPAYAQTAQARPAQAPIVHQTVQPAQQRGRQETATAARPTTATQPRQLTQIPHRSVSMAAAKPYTRPIPYAVQHRESLSPVRTKHHSEFDVNQYLVRDHSPPRQHRLSPRHSREHTDRWIDENLSDDDSYSSATSSSGRTSMTSESYYMVSPAKRHGLSPHTKEYHSVSGRSRKSRESSRVRHVRSGSHRHQEPRRLEPAPVHTVHPALRPALKRNNSNTSYDVKVEYAARPPLRGHSDQPPRAYARSRHSDDEDSDYSSQDEHDIYERMGRMHIGAHPRAHVQAPLPPDPYNNRYTHDGMASYGTDRRRVHI